MKEDDLLNIPLSLAIFDFVPVIFFLITCTLVGLQLKKTNLTRSIFFLIGGFVTFVGGFLQALWKLMINIKEKNISALHSQFKFTMPFGLLLMLFIIIISKNKINWKSVKSKLLSFPCIVFLILAIMFVTALMTLLFVMKSNEVKYIWIKESVNTALQASVCFCVLFSFIGKQSDSITNNN